MPGAPIGVQKEDPTIAELLKPLGYATAQVGKNQRDAVENLGRWLSSERGDLPEVCNLKLLGELD